VPSSSLADRVGPALRSKRLRRAIQGAGLAAVLVSTATFVWLAVRSMKIGFRSARFVSRAARLRLHKRCPECAERVRGEARVCKHCGHRFG
jgi:rRNA maturation endonuclease Nob1